MNKKYKQFLAFSLVGVGALSALSTVSAATLPTSLDAVKATHEQVHSAIKQALSSGDYQAFLTATKDKQAFIPIITEAQFNILVQAEKLRTAGDEAGAKKLLDDAGITPKAHGTSPRHSRGDRGMMHKGGGHGRKGSFANLTPAQKEIMKQAHDLMKAGKKDEAETLLKNAGITIPKHMQPREATTTTTQ